MPVYIDKMNARYGRMIMCHMLADTEEELLDMAEKIGVNKKWHQYPGTYKSHFDICLAKKKIALGLGAIEIDKRQLSNLMKRKKEIKVENGNY